MKRSGLRRVELARSELKRLTRLTRTPTAKTGLPRRNPSRSLKRSAKAATRGRSEPGYEAWKTPIRGDCAACGQPGPLVRHHVLPEQRVRREGGDVYDPRNSMELGRWCVCHEQHTNASHRLAMVLVPDDAIDYTSELLGPGAAYDFFIRTYGHAEHDARLATLTANPNPTEAL